MIHIKFRNFEKSELAREAVMERVEPLMEKFPDLAQSRVQVSLQMDNSPAQPGQDLFKVKIFVSRGRYDGITVEKENSNLYIALADVVDHMLEALNRYGDRVRVREIKVARQLNREMGQGGERDMGHNSEDNERIHD